MINKVVLIGNAGNDPETHTLDNGTVVGKFSLATNESYQDKNGEWQKQTEWHTIIGWNDLAKSFASRIKKGMLIYIDGKIKTRKWADDAGQNHTTTEIVASSFRLITTTAYANTGNPNESEIRW